jgi:predicted alpha/beta hydrolase family esterase
MKKQVVLIHGGDTYDTYEQYLADLKGSKMEADAFLDKGERRWRDRLFEVLGDEYEVFNPEMPNWMNAKYAEWKIWFEKVVAHVRPGAIYVGHSLGAIFLAKYFAENDDHGLAALFMLAAPFAQKGEKGMADFLLPEDLSRLAKLGPKVHLYHSEDDPVVVFSDLAEYRKALPDAEVRVFKKGGHFRMVEFPELVADIRAIR